MTPRTLACSDPRESELQSVAVKFVWRVDCLHQLRIDGCSEEHTVIGNRISAVKHNEAAVKSKESGLKSSRDVPTDFAFAEYFGGGSECLPFWRPSLWPFRSIRLFEEEDE